MESKLKYLYTLQLVDSQLQEVHELKGDLPMIVEEMDIKINSFKTKIKELNTVIKELKIERDKTDVEILDLAAKIDKYKSQQLNVKSNKQYDALTREIDAAERKSLQLEKSMDSIEGKLEASKKDLEIFSQQLEESSKEFEERRKELRDVNKEHEKEVLQLKHQRDKVIVHLEKIDIEKYDRIKKAKGGIAIVPIKRGSCGGCYSRIPPQKILEIRQNSKVYACEQCGRLLVSDQIVKSSTEIK